MSNKDDGDRVHLGGGAVFDKDLLGGGAPKMSAGYVASIEGLLASNINKIFFCIWKLFQKFFLTQWRIFVLAGGDVDDDEDEMDTSAMPNLGIRQVKIDVFF